MMKLQREDLVSRDREGIKRDEHTRGEEDLSAERAVVQRIGSDDPQVLVRMDHPPQKVFDACAHGGRSVSALKVSGI